MVDDVRVYLPATMAVLAELLADGRLAPRTATAVTQDLRAALPGLDEEELELEALLDAADLSLALLRDDASAPRRRVVVAADVPGSAVTAAPDRGPTTVAVGVPIPFRTVASVHVDEPGSESRVAVGEVADLDLLWYAPQEVGDLLQG